MNPQDRNRSQHHLVLKLLLFTLLTFLAGNSLVRADYPSGVLGLQPLLYFRLNETVTPLFDTATNQGTEGASANALYSGGLVHPVSGVLPGNAAAAFDGVSGKIQAPYDAVLNPGGAFSVEAWLKPGVVNGSGVLTCALASGHFAGPRWGWLIYQSDTGWVFRMYNGVDSNFTIALNSGGTLTAGTWYHLLVAYSGSSVTIYTNGVLANTGTPSAFAANTDGPFSIGTRSDNAFFWNGTADEVVLYTNAVAASIAAAHYAAATTNAANYGAQVLASAPAGYWRLGEALPARVSAPNIGSYGSSANGAYFDGTTTGNGPRPGDSLPGFDPANNAPVFDGSSGYVRIPQGTNNLTGAALTSLSEATFMCWVKRNGPQADYKGLVAMRPFSNGLYMNTDDTLNYSWNDAGNTWGFNSQLIPPDGEWTLAAVVVRPAYALFYMGSVSGGFVTASNGVSHAPADFTSGPFAVGRDINFGGAGRFFNGAIDEAAVFTNALSEGAIQSLFFTAIGSNAAPFMVSDPPAISPTGTVYSTTTFTLTPDVAGALPLTYVWRKNGTPISVANTAPFVKANAAVSDSGNYDVVVTNNFGAVTSQVVNVTVNPAVPPTITQQPASRYAYAGGAASFTVAATGTTPFTYQWKHAGTNLPGATGTALSISGVDATKTGSYLVTVGNVAGNVDSATATLSIRTPPAGSFEAALVSDGPVSYWRLDETSGTTAFDHIGGHDGTYSASVARGTPGALNGDSDGAATFNGVDSFVGTGSSLMNGMTNFSLVGWVRRGGSQANRTGLFGQNDNVEFGYISDQTIECWDNVLASAIDVANPLANGAWGLVCVTSDGTNRAIYVNGQSLGSAAARTTPLTNTFAFNIGGGGIFDGANNWFLGDLDDVALFNKALSADQINTLYLIGAYGSTTAPFIVKQPVSRTNAVGSTARFTVVAAGSVPLGYQWRKNNTPIPGATSSTLNIPNVYFTDAGNYSVLISNGVGTTNSATVTLTVMPAPTFANLTNSLVLHLKFDGNYNDSSGRGNNSLSVNASLIAGKIGTQAVHVNTDAGAGTYNYVLIADPNSSAPYPDLQFGAADSFSVAYWSRYTGQPNDLPILGNAINSTYQQGFVFSDDTGRLEWTLVSVTPDTGSVIADPVPGSPLINDGNWHHVVVSFDRVTATADSFVDGVQVDSRSIAAIGNLDTGNGIYLGQDPSGLYGVTAAYDLDDLGIWRKALTGYDALSIYNAGQNSKESFDVYGPVKVYLTAVGGNIDISWQAGTLLQSSSINGPYTPVSGATPPFYRTTASGSTRFFRVQQ